MSAPRSILRDADPGAAGGGTSTGGSGATATAAAGTTATTSGGGAAAATTTAADAPAPYWKGLYADDGKIDKAALDRLPEHLKGFKDLFGRAETIDAALNMWGNANALASKKALTPIDPAAPEHVRAERKAILDQALNVPKEPKGYGIKRPDALPEEHWNQAGADKFAQLAHKHSLSPDAVREIMGLQFELTGAELAKGQEAEATFYREQDAAFAKAAREAGLDADRATEVATRGAAVLGIDPKAPIFKNAEVRLACMKVTALVSEDKVPNSGDPAGLGKQDYRTMARDIMSNPQNPLHKAWNDPTDPRNEEAKEKVNQLYRMHRG